MRDIEAVGQSPHSGQVCLRTATPCRMPFCSDLRIYSHGIEKTELRYLNNSEKGGFMIIWSSSVVASLPFFSL